MTFCSSSTVHQRFSMAARRWRKRAANIDQAERERLAPQVIAEINSLLEEFGIHREPQNTRLNSSLFHGLNQEGVTELGPLLNKRHIMDLRRHLQSCPTYNAHVVAQSNKLPLNNKTSEFASYRLSDIVAAPHVLETANDPKIISLAEEFLGCVPTIYSMNTWWSRPAPDNGTRTTQSFHRDIDDYRFLSLFIYLSDVTMETGPHQYAIGSHTSEGLANILAHSLEITADKHINSIQQSREFCAVMEYLNKGQCDLSRELAESIFGGIYRSYTGPAGTGLIMTPAGFHKGLTPKIGARLMLWIRYGTHENAAVLKDHITRTSIKDWQNRISDSPKARYMNRLILDIEN